MSRSKRLRVAVVARAVHPLHRIGGLERSVYDLVRHLLREDVDVTLVTRTPDRAEEPNAAALGSARTIFVPYRTFPLAWRR